MTSDIGSLILLDEIDDLDYALFRVNCYTEGYASPEYVEAVNSGSLLTK
jgi:hypothetical protein